jgi:hypothetical protein
MWENLETLKDNFGTVEILTGPWRLSLEPWRIILGPWKLGLETWRIILKFSMLNLEPWRIITGPWSFFLKPWRKFWGLGGSTLAYAKTRIFSHFIYPKPEKNLRFRIWPVLQF